MKKALVTGLVLLAACAGANKEDAGKVSFTFQAQLDSGNAAYRRGDFKKSAKYFHQATRTDPENLSGYYGVYMAESKLGNEKEAARAKAFVAERAPTMPITQHPTTKEAQTAAGVAPTIPANPHAPTADNPHGALPIDSIRAAKAKETKQ